MIVINGKNKILGRLASEISEKLLKSQEKIVVVNAGGIIISGDSKFIFEKYHEKRNRGGKGNPENNPKYPIYPHTILKRTVRGMLPRSPKGKLALKKLSTHIYTPEEFKSNLPKEVSLQNLKHINLLDLSLKLGAKIRI